ncbi:YveK family protein [Jannaschia sp. R86511]|uniref:YveK family protein n=1 Tax=Jannaschia sp. R86511 TaxID=3093853 RepID=UPI0036D28893
MPAERFDPLLALLRSWWVVLLCVVAGATVLGLALSQAPERWTASTTLLVSTTDPSAALTGVQSGGGDVARTLNTQVEVVRSDAVTAGAAEQVGTTAREVREDVTVTVEQDSNVLVISAEAGTAEQAQELATAVTEAYLERERSTGATPLLAQADAVAGTLEALQEQLADLPEPAEPEQEDPRVAAFAGQIAELTQQESRLRSAAELYAGQASVLSAATAPEAPSSPGGTVGLALGAVLGLVLGVLIALGRGWVASTGERRPVRRTRSEDEPADRTPGTTASPRS